MSEQFKNNEIVNTLFLQESDKGIRKDITLDERNDIMRQMLETDCDFLLVGNTFFNKKVIYLVEFQPVQTMQSQFVNRGVQ
jgi:hypothetical protein